MKWEEKSVDIAGRKLVALRDVQDALAAGASRILVAGNCVVTPSARDFLQQHNIALVTSGSNAVPVVAPIVQAGSGAAANRSASRPRLFSTPEAETIKKEICAVGRKLWMRQFVDGDGGCISCRIGPNEVLCTPALVSKNDLTPEDLCLVDLEGNQIAGTRPRTSEISLHLEIYKAVPEAKATVQCRPPHATAYSIAGRLPSNSVIPGLEALIGKVAIAPYETPGTAAFAQSFLTVIMQHNAVLLSNYGIVCWADTVTRAEWYAEALETYCRTTTLASQLGAPVSHLPQQFGSDPMAARKSMGPSGIRFDASKMKECQLSDLEVPSSIPSAPCKCGTGQAELEALVKSVTDAVIEAIGGK